MYAGNDESRDKIVQALLRILERAPYDDISVNRISDAAGLPRRIFFQIFESKEEVLEIGLDLMLEEFAAKTGRKTISTICEATHLMFAFFKEERHVLRLYINNDKTSVICRECHDFLLEQEGFDCHFNGIDSPEDEDYAMTFFISGMVGLLEQCVREDSFSDERADDLAQMVCRLTGTCDSSDGM